MMRYSWTCGCACATLACVTAFTNADVFPISLTYNFNGMTNTGEANNPDAPDGFRSISDRALSVTGAAGTFGAAPLVGGTGLTYTIVSTAGLLDIVHLGDRNLTDGGNWIFDAAPDGDNIGIQPTWLPDTNQTGAQVSALGTPVTLDATSQIGVLYQISNGGGLFEAQLFFSDSSSVVVTLQGPDWFQNQFPGAPGPGLALQTQLGVYPGTQSTDRASAGAPLNVAEAVIGVPELLAAGLGDYNGRQLTAIAFQSQSNALAGYAILAASVRTNVIPPPAPENDECADATPIGEGNFSGTSNGATGASGSVCVGNDTLDVWYRYTASHTGQARIQTCESGFDTTLEVFDTCGGLSITCNDDTCGFGSEVFISTTQGQSYLIRIAGFEGARGNFALTVANPPDVLRGPIVNPANGNSYYLLGQTDWATAESISVGLGGHLAAVSDAAENDWIRANMLSYDGRARTCWIGFNDVAVEGTFEWVSGDAVTFTNWNDGEPNDAVGGEDFTEMQSSGGWNDLNGTQPLYGLAEVEGGCVGDLDGNGDVSLQDLAILLSHFGTTSGANPEDGDIDNDDDVDLQDLATLLSRFGTQC